MSDGPRGLVVGISAIVVLLRFRQWKAVGAAAAGIFSSAASIAVAVVVAMFGLVALGYWEPPVGQIVSDALGAGQAAYDLAGEWVDDWEPTSPAISQVGLLADETGQIKVTI